MVRREVYENSLENYILYSSIANIPFSYTELMNLPVKMINTIFKMVEKEYERKNKQMQQAKERMG